MKAVLALTIALARSTPGFSGADLSNVLNEAAILAARRRNATIDAEDIEDAVDRPVAGPAAESRIMTETERRLTAVLDRLAHALLERETLQGPELERVFSDGEMPRGELRTATRPDTRRQRSAVVVPRPAAAAAMRLELPEHNQHDHILRS
jgi:ATP-dependent Zn protease